MSLSIQVTRIELITNLVAIRVDSCSLCYSTRVISIHKEIVQNKGNEEVEFAII